VIAARHGFVGGRFVEGLTVEHDRGQITAVRPWAAGDPEPLPGTLMPGLVNAHLHAELSWAHRQIPGGQGFAGWVDGLLALRRPEGDAPARQAVAMLLSHGTAAVSDICNGPDTGGLFAASGIGGVVQRERFGMHGPRLAGLLAEAAQPPVRHSGRVPVISRASPHAVYSTPAALIQATAGAEGLGYPASIHISEDPLEHAFLADGSGPMSERLDAMGADWSWYQAPGLSPIAWLDALGVLGPGLLLVHGVHLDAADRDRIAAAGASLCICARSNLHIGGQLPDLPALLESGCGLALGTDSLGSCDDLDVLSEVPVLHEAFPQIPVERLVSMATAGGADALGLGWAGRIEVGRAPGLVLYEAPPAALYDAPRRWLVPPGVL